MPGAHACSRGGPTRPLIAPVCLLASACTTLGPDFAHPTVPSLAPWSSGRLRATVGDGVAVAASPVDDWWRTFNDPALDALVAEARRENRNVRTAGLRIMEARAQLGIAGSGRYPQRQRLSGNVARGGREQTSGPDTAAWSCGAGFDVAWELDFWGKFQRGIEAADANYFASIAQYDDVQVLVAAQTASIYATIRTIELRLRIARESAALQQRSLEHTGRLFKSGNES
jgi:outer membrane protein TolC